MRLCIGCMYTPNIQLFWRVANSKAFLPTSGSDWAFIALIIVAIVTATAAIRENGKRMRNIRRKYCNTKIPLDKH